MENPNETIQIYNGDFKLKYGEYEINLSGGIQFEWLPSCGIQFHGGSSNVPHSTLMPFQNAFTGDINVDLHYGDTILKDCRIVGFGINNFINIRVHGISNRPIEGDKTIPVRSIQFSITNLRDFVGIPVTETDAKGTLMSKKRLIFENESYVITIDKIDNFENKRTFLKAKGGYIILYTGEIIGKGSITLTRDNTTDLLHCFATFLSFMNGRRVSILFRKGLFDGNVIWTDYIDYPGDQYKSVISWPSNFSIEGFNELWQEFGKVWKEDKDFLISAIHWYVESNSGSGYAQGSIIMAQTNLELIYNWLLVEKKGIILRKDAESISAAGKIRLLLSQLTMSNEIPRELVALKSITDFEDGPDAFVQIRNSIVHSQEAKRKKLVDMDINALFQALQLGVWYQEMAILNILKYNGMYVNRCALRGGIESNKLKMVPWKK